MTLSGRATPLATAAVIVGVAVFACYLNTLQADFVYDDPFLITGNPLVVSEDLSVLDIFREEFFGGGRGASGFYRPLMILLYRLEFRFFGAEPALFHAVNVATHVGGALVLLLLLRRLRIPLAAAAAGALFFGLHPVNCESVAWISGGANATVFLLMAGGLLFLLRFLDGERGFRSVDLWISCVLFLLALLAKESALIVPVVALLLLTCRGGAASSGRGRDQGQDHGQDHGRDSRWGRLRYFVPFLVIAAAYLAMHVYATDGGREEVLFYGRGTFFEKLATFFAVVPKYLQLLLVCGETSIHELCFQNELNIARPLFLSPGLLDFWSGAGLLVLLALAAALVWAWRKGDRAILVGAGLVLFTLLSVSTMIPFAYNFREMDFPFFERYMYVASAGLGCLLALGIGRLLEWVRERAGAAVGRPVAGVFLAIALVWLGAFGVIAHSRNKEWNNDLLLFRTAVERYPLSPTLLLNLGEALFKAGRFEKAAETFHQSWVLAPAEPMALVNEAIARLKAGEACQAEEIVRGLLESDPDNCQALDTLGMIRVERDDLEGALPCFGKAFRLSGGEPSFGNNLAHLLVELRGQAEKLFLAGEIDRVLELADRVIAEAPRAAWAFEVRGVILDDRGDEEGAAEALSRAVSLSPDSLFAATRLLPILRRNGYNAEALEVELYIERARKRLPADVREAIEGGGEE